MPESRKYPFEYNFVNSLQRSPANPNMVVAVLGPAVYRSSDDGEHWTMRGYRGVGTGNERVIWHPSKAGEVWQFGDGAFFEPYLIGWVDYGLTLKVSWDFTALGLPGDGIVEDMAFDAASPDVFYAATSFGLIKTENGGNSWRLIDSVSLSIEPIYCMVSDPRTPHSFFLAGGNRVYHTVDGLSTFETVFEIRAGEISCIAFEPGSNRLFVGTLTDVCAVLVSD